MTISFDFASFLFSFLERNTSPLLIWIKFRKYKIYKIYKYTYLYFNKINNNRWNVLGNCVKEKRNVLVENKKWKKWNNSQTRWITSHLKLYPGRKKIVSNSLRTIFEWNRVKYTYITRRNTGYRAKGGRVITQFANRFSVLINKFLLARDIMEC